ncbi:MAG: MaoC family dehydratase N-terminal domain-containing protein [Proteobacteria bacterium]|nr:MaoC family dehydratase N-terminal domain-containing protein [Pseudomonadota bacterium]
MSELITPEVRAWIGRVEPTPRVEVTRRDIIKYSVATGQRQPKYLRGDEAPPMFLFGALREIVPIDALGPDGIQTSSMMPELPLKRIMAGGTKTRYTRPVRSGDVLVGKRTLADIYSKQGSGGPLIFVVVEIEIETEAGETIMRETQTRIVR